MNDSNVATVDPGSVHDLKNSDSRSYSRDSQLIGLRNRAAGSLSVRIKHVSAAVEHLAGDGVKRSSRLRTEKLGRLNEIVVNRGEKKHIGKLNKAAVLLDLLRNNRHRELLTVGSNTLGERHEHLGKRVVLAELDLLTAVFGDRLLLTKLIVDQLGLCKINEIVRVVGSHLMGETSAFGESGIHTRVGVHVTARSVYNVSRTEERENNSVKNIIFHFW